MFDYGNEEMNMEHYGTVSCKKKNTQKSYLGHEAEVKGNSKKAKIFYVAHSNGTT